MSVDGMQTTRCEWVKWVILHGISWGFDQGSSVFRRQKGLAATELGMTKQKVIELRKSLMRELQRNSF